MVKNVKIYAIICPVTKDVKYIGKTFGTLKDRLSKHFYTAKDNSKKKKWINESIKNNIYPEIILIDEVDNVLSNITEQKWILHYGIENLLNENKGGGGSSIRGYDDFLHHKIEIIALCDVNQLNDFERKFIKDFDSNNRNSGLNLTSGGQDYFYHNKETRAKMSIAQMGNKKTLGRVQTKEEIQKRIKKIKGLKRSEEFKEKCRKRITGKKLSEATIEKLKGNKNATAKTVIDIKSGELFYSAVEASKKIGIKKTTLTAWLNGQNTNKSNFRYL